MRQVTIDDAVGRIDAKPVIYLYPEVETQVTVKMDYSGKLTCTYPAYNDGWQVTAAPDGENAAHEMRSFDEISNGMPSIPFWQS